jgi:hypothetical protein
MKKLLILLFALIGFTSFANPIKLRLENTRITTAIDGTTIGRGDQFDVVVQGDGNGNTTTRQLMFDFQYDAANFDIISVTHTGTGGNGGILPSGSTISISHQPYPGYTYNNSNATNVVSTNGNVRWTSTFYTFQDGGANGILRSTLTWSTPNGMPYAGGWDRFVIVRMRVKPTSTATSFNPFKINFVAGWNAQGVQDATYHLEQLSTEILFDQNIGKYVTANVDVNSNLLALSSLRVSFRNTATNTGQLFNVTSNGNVDIDQTLLTANTTYEVSLMHDMDKTNTIYNSAITLSDFTTAQGEFTSMGLDGSNGQILKTGQSLYAADINRNKSIDGGDLPRLLAQVVGLDTLVTVPANYVSQGANTSWRSVPTWRATDVTTTTGQVEWIVIAVNAYTAGVSKVLIDMREFGNIDPTSIKALQLLDLYSGPVEFVSQDASWATYKVFTNFSTIPTSVFTSAIRFIQGGDYGIKAEVTFNASVDNSWSTITASNWKTITFPKVTFTTGALGSNQILNLKYLLWGDVNRSHSSQVVVVDNGSSAVATNAKASMLTNTAFRTMNSTVSAPTSIDVNLSNVTVTSNDIVIPIAVNTKGASLGGLQFQFNYDPTKLKFNEVKSDLPANWYVFANAKSGIIKFGALDQSLKTPITTNTIPFRLRFTAIGSGIDILTSIRVSPTMDANDSKGNQLGINLNTDRIKLTGYNNF